MKVFAEAHTRDYATVHFVPSVCERIIGRRSRERAAFGVPLRNGGIRWHWLNGDQVDRRSGRALDEAYRSALVVRATSPPV